jgi:hypothetical protein
MEKLLNRFVIDYKNLPPAKRRMTRCGKRGKLSAPKKGRLHFHFSPANPEGQVIKGMISPM